MTEGTLIRLPPHNQVDELLRAWLTRRSIETPRAYLRDLVAFAQYLGEPDARGVATRLLGQGPGEANAVVHGFRDSLLKRGLAPASVNRRLSALRSLARLARSFGLITWAIDVPGERVIPYRDTRGPGLAGVQAILAAAGAQGAVHAARDVALVRLLWDLALRRGEICSLDGADYERAQRRLSVRGKGEAQAQWLTLPEPTLRALDAWLALRSAGADGALLLNLDRAHGGGRLSSNGIYRIVRELAARGGVHGIVSPHRLRHSAITYALDATGGDVRRVRQFSRHAKLETLLLYDDRRRDEAAEVATLLAAAIGSSEEASAPAPRDAHENAHYRDLPEPVATDGQTSSSRSSKGGG